MDKNLEELIEKCDTAELNRDYKKLIGLTDEILKLNPNNQIAIEYKSFAYLNLKEYVKAEKLLEKGRELYPENHYLKNNSPMLYYELGDYEKSLMYCEEGLKIYDNDWLYKNKMKALIMRDRIDEAIELYENMTCYAGHPIGYLLFDAGKYMQARDYYLKEDEFDLIDKLKISVLKNDSEAIFELGDYYLSWINKIKYKHDVKVCPNCGGELIPILWGYPDNYDLEKSAKGELHLGGCSVIVPWGYHCKNCKENLNLGYKGLEIECGDDKLYDYIKFKIRQITNELKIKSRVFIKTTDTVKEELKYFDEKEFDAFIEHLLELNYILEPKKGYIKLADFDNYKIAKEHPDDGKYAAPRWMVYPQLPPWSSGWEMGYGKDYTANHPHDSKEYGELFPVPQYWLFKESESRYKPHPLLAYFWNEDGKPKYPKGDTGLEVNDFIDLNQIDVFQSDLLRFNSIEHAILLSKYLHFEKCEREESLKSLKKGFELTEKEEETWDIFKYSVCLNAAYFKIMERNHLKKKLLDTGDEYLVYKSDDDWGGDENLFGRALMEIRDEIRRIYKNEDKIDWEYSEYLKCNS